MKFACLLVLLFTSCLLFSQDKEVWTYVNSPDSQIKKYIWHCSTKAKSRKECIDKPLLDGLQKKLDDKNIACRDKEYYYYMVVYTDCSYDFEKEYKWSFNTVYGEQYRRSPLRGF